ncbi:MAG: hypothetical protein ACXWRZ_16535 [Bdellovibrio sp.]
MSIIEVMVAAGIMSIVMLGTMTMILSQRTESKALTEKLASLDLEKILISSLSDGKICKAELTTPSPINNVVYKVNISNPSQTEFKLSNGIHMSPTDTTHFLVKPGDQVSPISNSLKIDNTNGVTIKNFTNIGTNLYSAEIWVSFDPTPLVRAIRPVVVKTTIFTNAAGVVTDCNGGGSAFGGMWINYSRWDKGCAGNYSGEAYSQNPVTGGNSCPPGFTDYVVYPMSCSRIHLCLKL